MITDATGNPLTGASAAAGDLYVQAQREFQIYAHDPVATIDAALADSPDFVMGHALRAWLHLLATEPAGVAVAREALAATQQQDATPREKAHLHAIALLADGQWWAASRALEDIAIAWPRDALALQVGHQVDFFTGNARLLRDRIARALPDWSAGMAGYHAMLSMHAFGLEEMGDYAAAEAAGRQSVELEPRDGWGQHAVAHVLEMQNRTADGIAWMRANPGAWSADSFFAVHNWWHLALYHLDRGDTAAVMALYDGPIRGGRSAMMLDLVDATAMLWRLHLLGVDVGARWDAVADRWRDLGDGGFYAFNDWHAAMAYAGAGRGEALAEVTRAVVAAASGAGDNAMFSRDVGLPLIRGVAAFAQGKYASALREMRPVRQIAHRFGGSHAQRDLIDLTLIEAALRAGDSGLARALAAERAVLKPRSPLANGFVQRAAGLKPSRPGGGGGNA